MDGLAVVIVTYQSEGVIGRCLDSLLAAPDPPRTVVVDNASHDRTRYEVAARPVELLAAPVNAGFAAGVNIGLRHLATDTRLRWFWILNPDCRVPPETPARYHAACADAGEFALLGGRTLYAGGRVIQSDGGRVNRWTGVCRLVNRGAHFDAAPPPESSLDFISGANMIASRTFLERAGTMPEDYFLFYEEVDWAMRRGGLPLRFRPRITVEHDAGTATGSAGPGRDANGFANYFNYRARRLFLRRHRPATLPVGLTYAFARSADLVRRGDWPGAAGAFRGAAGFRPPRAVRDRLRASGALTRK